MSCTLAPSRQEAPPYAAPRTRDRGVRRPHPGGSDRSRDHPRRVGGSRAERPDSDVDLCLLVTDEAFEVALAAGRLSWVEQGAGYEHGYYDIKVVTSAYLEAAAERGDDPVRAAFLHARVVWARVDGVAELLDRIPDVPAEQWEARIGSHIAQARLHGRYFLSQGHALGNRFLTQHAAVHLVASGGRALLALNHVLFQGPKYLEELVARAPRKPDGYAEAAASVLSNPTPQTGSAYLELLEEFHDWPYDFDRTLSRFVLDNELAWLFRTIPPEYS